MSSKNIDLSPQKINKGKELFIKAVRGDRESQTEFCLTYTSDQLDLLLAKHIDAPQNVKDKFLKLLEKRLNEESNSDSAFQ